MANSLAVSCIRKPVRSPHTHIEGIGGITNGQRWYLTEDQAIADIKNGSFTFHVKKGERDVQVIIGTREGREYLKTEEDDTRRDNLLSLPECPP
jgi:hypothetical protein